MSTESLLFAAFVFVLAGFIKGTLGLGLPTVSIGLLATVMPPMQAAAILIVPSLLTNIWQMFVGPYLYPLIKRLWPMLACLSVAIWIGSGLMLAGSRAKEATILLGAVLALYSLAGLFRVRFHVPPKSEWWLGPVIGFTTGLLASATGVFAVPSVPYLVAIGIEKDEMIQALGLFFTVATLALGSGLAATGYLNGSQIVPSALALVMASAGMWIGQHARSRMDAASFRLWFLVGQLLLGLYLAARALVG